MNSKLNTKNENVIENNKKNNEFYICPTQDNFNKENYVRHHSPSNKEWKNSIYSYNNNTSILASTNNKTSDSLIKMFFNLIPKKENSVAKHIRDLISYSSTRKLFVSKPEIKHTNDKVIITLYSFNREIKYYIKKIYYIIKRLNKLVPLTMGLKDDAIFSGNYNRFLYKFINKKYFTKVKKRKRLRKRFLIQKFKINKYVQNFNENFEFKNKYLYWYRKSVFIPFIRIISRQLNVTLYKIKTNFMIEYPKQVVYMNGSKYKFSNKEKEVVNALNSFSQFWKFLLKADTITKCFSSFNIIPVKFKTVFIRKDNKYKLPLDNNKVLYEKSINNVSKVAGVYNYNAYKHNTRYLQIIYSICKYVVQNVYGNLFSDFYYNWINKVYLKRTNKFFFNEFFIRRKLFINKFRTAKLVQLKYLLEKCFNKKVQLNLVNLKYIHLNSDLMINAVSKKLIKKTAKYRKILKRSFKLAKLPNKIENRQQEKFNPINIFNLKSNRLNKINKTGILNNLKYKWTTGIKIEIRGKLAANFSASRSTFKFKNKGNLRNLDSYVNKRNTTKSPSIVKIRGINNPNLQYTFTSNKRRMGAFGVKGWISSN